MRDVRRGVVISPPRRAWLVAGGGDGGVVGRWRSAAAARRGPTVPGPGAKLAVGGDLTAAEATISDTAKLEVADVIYRRSGPEGTPPPTWLAGVLDRYPGCAVAAMSGGPGWYLTAPRVSRSLVIGLLMPNDYGFNALVGAMFVYGWLAASWPLAPLERSRLEAIAVAPLPRYRVTELIPFGLYYAGRRPGPAGVVSRRPRVLQSRRR
jgi:hypothetical protein